MTFGVHCDASNYCFNFSPITPTLLGASFHVLLFERCSCVGPQDCQIFTSRLFEGMLPYFLVANLFLILND